MKNERLNHVGKVLCVCQCVRAVEANFKDANRHLYLVTQVAKKLELKYVCVRLCKPASERSSCQRHRGGERAGHMCAPVSVGENNNKLFLLFEAAPITFPPLLRSPLHCPSASHKSKLSSADVPLKFRNAQVGIWGPVSYGNTWEG